MNNNADSTQAQVMQVIDGQGWSMVTVHDIALDYLVSKDPQGFIAHLREIAASERAA